MNYSLGNMLGGAGALNADKLSLDLQFAADKTLTARKGPTPTFTRASSATFVGSNGLIQSAAVNAARFDHDPVTLACKGLLIEESRTNLCLRSENFGTTWSTFNSSTSLISQVAPNGDSSAYSLVESIGLGIHSIFQTIAFASTTNYTFSVFVRAGTRDFVSLVEQSSGNTIRRTFFNLSTGAVGTKNASHTASTQQLPNGWWRLIISFTSGAAANANIAIELASADNVSSYLGNGSGNVFLWGAQVEAGSFPTSYIPTVASSVVRSVDVCSITGSNFTGMYNPVEGSFATSQIFNAPTSYSLAGQVVFDVNDTTSLNRTRILRLSNTGYASYLNTVGGTTNVQISGSTAIVEGAVTKLAGCMKANDFTIYFDNVSQGVDTVATMQSAPTTFTIGDVSSGAATRAPINGTIASIRYFKKRLSDAKLQSLTA
jgi:hypothetical protein